MKQLTTIVFGDPFIGTSLHGVYEDVEKAKEASKQKYAFPFFSTEQIEYDQEVDLSEGSKLFTIAHGNPFEKMSLTGLWNNPTDAIESTTVQTLLDWHVVEIDKSVT